MEKRYYPQFHIAPDSGWLNDPNGTCFFDGTFHVFYQHASSAKGGLKSWGHTFSKNLLDWKDTGDALFPDTKDDKDGAYSGGAFLDDGELEVFYTGNVKHAGNFDYINEGRGHNVIRAWGFDGKTFTKKETILTNDDYPSSLSCHVRDPKVWKVGNEYFMLLGARTKKSHAALLLLKSCDKKTWKTAKLYEPKDDFGYMLECPDFFTLNGKSFLSFCPQGIPSQSGTGKFQNVYHSGYVSIESEAQNALLDEKIDDFVRKENFLEWDKGFDFYAPQTFALGDGRFALIGWAGVPDAPYTNEASIREGWQHSMTLIRELTLCADGSILQNPLKEFDSLRKNKIEIKAGEKTKVKTMFDATIQMNGNGRILFDNSLEIKAETGVLSLEFLDKTGEGRKKRTAFSKAENLRMIFDRSILEIFADGGKTVFTTRWYPLSQEIQIESTQNVLLWEI